MKFGIWELLVILVIVALLFGTKKLRSIGSDLGNAIKGFRGAIKDEDDAGGNEENRQGNVIEGEIEPKDNNASRKS